MTIIISQARTRHSRLGNSLGWMLNLYPVLDARGFTAVFPWANENFSSYLRKESFWLSNPERVNEIFLNIFGIKLNADNLASLSRSFQSDYEKKNALKAFSWDSLVISDPDKSTLYLCGNIRIYSQDIIDLMRNHKITIMHEPYQFDYQKVNNQLSENINHIKPRDDLFNRERQFIESVSGSRPPLALHIRRGDYFNWQGGIHYHDDNFWIDEAKKFIRSGYAVWVFSNDLSPELESALTQVGCIISRGTFEVDFVRLMLMKEIYGPSSTFSALAKNISNSLIPGYCNLSFYPPKG